jgi:hypothetical protein
MQSTGDAELDEAILRSILDLSVSEKSVLDLSPRRHRIVTHTVSKENKTWMLI